MEDNNRSLSASRESYFLGTTGVLIFCSTKNGRIMIIPARTKIVNTIKKELNAMKTTR
jgi:hypothetical protein